ncbi:MAG: hypothetical protein IK099_14750 [Clostridia bacterium]|nr:hypothetical protein [Clostridia bacterium]
MFIMFPYSYKYKVFERAPFATRKSQRLASATAWPILFCYAILLFFAEIIAFHGIIPMGAVFLVYLVSLAAFFLGLGSFIKYEEEKIKKEAADEYSHCANMTPAEIQHRVRKSLDQHEELGILGWMLVICSVLWSLTIIKANIAKGCDFLTVLNSCVTGLISITFGAALIAFGRKRSIQLAAFD